MSFPPDFFSQEPLILFNKLTIEQIPFQSILPQEDIEKADQLWQSALQTNPSLFDGKLLHITDIKRTKPDQIHIQTMPIPYRYFYADRHDNGPNLSIFSLGVTGLTRFQDKILLGQRSGHVTQYPGYWELAPSGTIEPSKNGSPDPVKQCVKELQEECGYSSATVNHVEPVCLFWDNAQSGTDIGCLLTLRSTKTDAPFSDEYGSFVWKTGSDILARKHPKKEKIIPSNHHFLNRFLSFI
ncbi:MAG: NUDIX domain-containing protein [Magnetococcales bacterium]|nr:NUDIX domain-containing protein [Magnetococcales bacterium]